MNLPNKITVFRFFCVPALLACALINFPYHWLATLIVYVIACLSDKADGVIARKRGLVTDFGKLMDPLADKALVFAAYIVLIDFGWHTDLVIMIMLIREFLVAGIRMAAAAEGEVIAANGFGKAKTLLQMLTTIAAFLFLALSEFGLEINSDTAWFNIYCAIAFWIVGIITMLSGIVYTKDGWHLIKTK